MGFQQMITNPIFWIWITIFLTIFCFALIVFLIILSKKTHAIVEFKAWIKGTPISIFFDDNGQAEWKAIKPTSGIIYEKDRGSFIVNSKATYIDRRTRNILMPFDSQFGVGVNANASKLADDLHYISESTEFMKRLRYNISNNNINESKSINALKTTVNMGAFKYMSNAILPHNLTAKIEKEIAARTRQMNKGNPMQYVLIFVSILGAIIMGFILLKTMGGG